jgi:hypothetical protein
MTSKGNAKPPMAHSALETEFSGFMHVGSGDGPTERLQVRQAGGTDLPSVMKTQTS